MYWRGKITVVLLCVDPQESIMNWEIWSVGIAFYSLHNWQGVLRGCEKYHSPMPCRMFRIIHHLCQLCAGSISVLNISAVMTTGTSRHRQMSSLTHNSPPNPGSRKGCFQQRKVLLGQTQHAKRGENGGHILKDHAWHGQRG